MKTMTRSLPSTSTYDSTHHRGQPWIFLARPYEPDDFIHANAAAGRHRQPAHHGMLKVVLGPRAPDDAPDVEPMQVVKILLRLVEEHHLPSLRPCADLTGASVGMLPGGVHDGAGGRQSARRITPENHPRRGQF